MRVLLAEDDRIARLKMERLLTNWGYEVTSVEDGPAAWAILRNPGAPSLAILDWMMPKLDGVALCRLFRKRTGQPYSYLIMLTARGGAEDVFQAVEAGADDYLVKPVDPEYLRSRLKIAHKILDLHEQLSNGRDQIRAAAPAGTVPGLISREAILTALDSEFLRTRRAGTPVGVVMAELDHLRNLVETHGQKGVNLILDEVGRRLRTGLRDGDKAGCLGDGEFLIAAPECNSGQVGPLAERLRKRISAEPLSFQSSGDECVTLSVTMSFGTFGVQCDADTDATSVLAEVGKALQQAKREGFDRVCEAPLSTSGRQRAATLVEETRPSLVAA
jgi:diguanylate cyclase (GGDEF)-like protein